MKKREIVVCLSVLLLVILLFFFKTTGFAVNSPKLIVSFDISSDQEKITPGQSVLLKATIRKPLGDIDQLSIVELEYSIKDIDGKIISSKKESGAISIKESTVASLLIPTSAKPGVYVASVVVKNDNETYEANKTFEVIGDGYNSSTAIYVLAILIILAFALFIFKRIRKPKRNIQNKRRRTYTQSAERLVEDT